MLGFKVKACYYKIFLLIIIIYNYNKNNLIWNPTQNLIQKIFLKYNFKDSFKGDDSVSNFNLFFLFLHLLSFFIYVDTGYQQIYILIYFISFIKSYRFVLVLNWSVDIIFMLRQVNFNGRLERDRKQLGYGFQNLFWIIK